MDFGKLVGDFVGNVVDGVMKAVGASSSGQKTAEAFESNQKIFQTVVETTLAQGKQEAKNIKEQGRLDEASAQRYAAQRK